MSRRRVLLWLLPLLLLLTGFRDAPLVDPAPLAIPAGVDEQVVLKTVRKTLNTRGWAVTEEHPGEIKSVLRDGDRSVRIDLSWSQGQLVLKYIDSQNLKYHLDEGTPYIHKNYLDWIDDLTRDLGAALGALATTK